MDQKRRRVLNIMALSSGLAICPTLAFAANKKPETIAWHGYAMGADTSIQLYAENNKKADEILKGVEALIAHYENIFSLYRPNSELSMLNKNGTLENPSADFIELSKRSIAFTKQTNGAFDVTIQPLWDHYESGKRDNVDELLPLIGSDKILLTQDLITFTQENMAISFNGIAQGYITDKVTEYLKAQGFENVLVDMGEYRASGPQISGEPWRIGLLDPFDTISIMDVIEMSGGAVATSGGYGNQFDASGEYHHLFNPQTGRSSDLYASVTVQANDATTADALSTAFSNMTESSIQTTLAYYSDVLVRLTGKDGSTHELLS